MPKIIAASIGVALALLTACGGGDSGTSVPPVLALAVASGGAQSATVGRAVATAPSVKVTSDGQAKAGVPVTFAVASGGGSVTGATATSDASGIATVGSWTVGTAVGANTLTATLAGGATASFTATGVAGPASVMTKAAGDVQTSSVAGPLATKPAVLVADQYGNPVSGVAVTFTLASGGGSITGTSATSGADGLATLGGWTLGNTAGPNTVTATASASGFSGSPVTFLEFGVAGPVATITKLAGDNLLATVGTLLGTNPSVQIADRFGNLVGNQTVTFVVSSGGGTVNGGTPTSSSTGVATIGSWLLGPNIGTNTLAATSGAAPPVTFTATGTPANTLPNLTGSWSGTWTDVRYGVSGPITNVQLTQTVTAFSGTGTIDLSALGLSVQSGTALGSVSANSISFTFSSDGIGTGGGVLSGTTGSGTGGVTALSLGGFTYTGTVSATTITGTFQFTSPTGGNGTITLTKQ